MTIQSSLVPYDETTDIAERKIYDRPFFAVFAIRFSPFQWFSFRGALDHYYLSPTRFQYPGSLKSFMTLYFPFFLDLEDSAGRLKGASDLTSSSLQSLHGSTLRHFATVSRSIFRVSYFFNIS